MTKDSEVPDPIETAKQLGRLAMECQRRGDLGEAEVKLREAVGLGRARPGLYHGDHLGELAWLVANSGDLNGASLLYREALDVEVATGGDGAVAVARHFLAEHLMRMESYEEVVGVLTEAVELRPVHRVTLARCHEAMGDLEAARRQADLAIAGTSDSEQETNIRGLLGELAGAGEP